MTEFMYLFYNLLINIGNIHVQYVVKVLSYSKIIVKFIHNNRNIWYNSLSLNNKR